MHLLEFILGAIFILPVELSTTKNSTYTNPMLPGWHSDPSCIFVAEENNSFFCATSSFLTFPGMPIYTSKDLVNWRLGSHVFSRPSQVPQIGNTTVQNGGLWATTIRYHDGIFYAIVSYTPESPFIVTGFIFTTTDPYNDNAWSDPLVFPLIDIDPNLFWDDDGTTYIQFSGIHQQTIDLETGILGPASIIWTGFTKYIPEGPRMYKKDGYYYLMIGEGGTELGHHEAIARSANIWGPYEGYSGNPILTATNTTQYFQTVGHADLFQDASGNWWGSALATRSGPAWENYPMGRETVLFPVIWNEGEWPVLQPLRGHMNGWQLPLQTRAIPGSGPFVEDPDVIDFPPGSAIPPHFLYWRFPPEDAFAVSPQGHPNTLQLRPSKSNLTSSAPLTTIEELSLIMRVQTDTLFSFSIDVVSFEPKLQEEEVGVTAFLTQTQHLDLGIVLLPKSNSGSEGGANLAPHLRFRVTNVPALKGDFSGSLPTIIKPLPESWLNAPIRLQIDAVNETHHAFSAASSTDSWGNELIGIAPATILSGGDGEFTGTLVGVYATSNGGAGTTESYISRWRYQGKGQDINNGTFVPYTPFVE
ncbi:glycoside hydrolase family 43 protein [Hyaloscypha hepaticicola]|uniref:Glycoside hydrolase family 43 protein n=1 Tax=Hyaloscypha hepaticicola TaxID=2082293 RepID=A0A2J6QL48_9HELO|nr:glycoside hydrolase family 43 protein [Hyaloscypha hepaticicola]